MKTRVVFDTNVLISGYLWEGKPRRAIKIIKSGVYDLLYCPDSLNELVRVLSVKFGLDLREIHAIVSDIEGMGERIVVKSSEQPIIADPEDNIFINLAMDGNAALIVSGDSHILNLKNHKGIEIVTVSEFVKRYPMK